MLIFNSKIESPEHLEELLIGRKDIVDAIEKSVHQGLLNNQNIQHLLIGTRGSGKTHVMHVLFNRFSNDNVITDKAIIGYMVEEEIGIDSLFSLIIRIFEAFIRWSSNNEEKLSWKTKINLLKDLKPYEREDKAKEFLLKFLDERKLLLLIENINEVFIGMKKTGQARLRDFIQQYEKVNIIATSQVLFADIQNEDKPFHNFFKITHLDRLSEEETKRLLQTFARTEGPPELESHFQTNRGISQMKSIHFLSGGNHRLIALFYEFLKIDIKSDMADPFLKTLDKLKPYYESFIRYLPPQQQKIIHFLALKHQPQLGSVVAKECFLTPGGTSKQMNELQNKGFIEAHRMGRDNKYELAEPMLRFCIELTDNRDGIIGMLARFITILYSDTEIINKYLKLKYLSPFNCPDGNLKKNQYEEILIYEKAGGENKNNIQHLDTLIQSIENESAKGALVKITMMSRDRYLNCPYVNESCPCNLLMDKEENNEKVWKLFIAELLKYSLFEEAFSLVSQVYKGQNIEKGESITIPILFIRGLFKSVADKKIIEEYILRLLDLPIDEFSKKLISVFLSYDIRKNKNAIYDLSKEERAILEHIRKTSISYHFPPEMLDIRSESNSSAKDRLYKMIVEKYPSDSYVLNDYANFLSEKNNAQEAAKYFLKAIEINPKEVEFTDDYGLFLLYIKKKPKLAKKFFLKSLEIEPKSLSYWFRYVDFLEDDEENISEAEKVYKKMIKVFPNSSKVFLHFGILQFYNDDYSNALENLNKAITINPENDCAYYYKGKLFSSLGNKDEAIKYFSKSIDIDTDNIPAYFDRSVSQFELSKLKEAQEDLLKIVNLLTNESIKEGLANNNQIICVTILNLLLIGILTNKSTLISKAEKYFEKVKLPAEVQWNYNFISLLKDIILSNSKTPPLKSLISSLKKSYTTNNLFTSYDPLLNWLRKDNSNNIPDFKRDFLIQLLGEIEKF
jgi:tetratricopeptide (TPR) repeat protein